MAKELIELNGKVRGIYIELEDGTTVTATNGQVAACQIEMDNLIDDHFSGPERKYVASTLRRTDMTLKLEIRLFIDAAGNFVQFERP